MPRIAGVFSLLLAFCLACFGQSGFAPNPLAAPATASPKVLPNHVKLLDPLTSSATRWKAAPAPGWKGWDSAPRAFADDRRCGHIVVIPVRPEIDPEMLRRLSRSDRYRMPTMKTMPPCPIARP